MNSHVDDDDFENDSSCQYMIAEYESLRAARDVVVRINESRVNFFLATASGTIVFLGVIAELSGFGEVFVYTSTVLLAFLLSVGTFTFLSTIELHIGNYIYLRGINRVRRFFLDSAPEIQRYLILPVHDDVPNFRSIAFNQEKVLDRMLDTAGLVALINSFVASVLVCIHIQHSFPISQTAIMFIGIFLGLLLFAGQVIYEAQRYEKAELENKANFPKDKTDSSTGSRKKQIGSHNHPSSLSD